MSVHSNGIINKQGLIFLYVGVFCTIIIHTIKYYIIIYYQQEEKNIKLNIHISLSNCIHNTIRKNNNEIILITQNYICAASLITFL